MSQDQIEQLLANAGHIDKAEEEQTEETATASPNSSGLNVDDEFNKDEVDVLGELGNISMGTAATTMSILMGRTVDITTPHLEMHTVKSLGDQYDCPLIVVEVTYIEGADGNNMLILKREDVARITDVLLGGDGQVENADQVVMDEIHLSAIQEVMNQMVGSSATAMSEMLGKAVNISTPVAKEIRTEDDPISSNMSPEDKVLKVCFKMDIEGVLNSEIMQIMPVDFAKKLVGQLLYGEEYVPTNVFEQSEEAKASTETFMDSANVFTQHQHVAYEAQEQPAPAQQMPPQQAPQQMPPQQMPPQQMPPQQMPPQQMPPQQMPPQQMPPQQGNPYGYPPADQYAQPYPYPPYPYPYPPYPPANESYERSNIIKERQGVDVKSAKFPNFDDAAMDATVVPENIDMIMDVPMKVTVELGKAKKKISEILDFNTGSVIVLDKIAGDPVDILVNGKLIGRGEVVVIEDTYGVRITEINPIAPESLL